MKILKEISGAGDSLYNIKVSDEIKEMIAYLRSKKVKLPAMLRDYIIEVYKTVKDGSDEDLLG